MLSAPLLLAMAALALDLYGEAAPVTINDELQVIDEPQTTEVPVQEVSFKVEGNGPGSVLKITGYDDIKLKMGDKGAVYLVFEGNSVVKMEDLSLEERVLNAQDIFWLKEAFHSGTRPMVVFDRLKFSFTNPYDKLNVEEKKRCEKWLDILHKEMQAKQSGQSNQNHRRKLLAEKKLGGKSCMRTEHVKTTQRKK